MVSPLYLMQDGVQLIVVTDVCTSYTPCAGNILTPCGGNYALDLSVQRVSRASMTFALNTSLHL